MSDVAITFKQALAMIPADSRSAEALSVDGLTVELYAPHESDEPTTDERAVVFIVINGSGFFRAGDARVPFGPGDLLHSPAGTEQQFEGFTPDFAVWRVRS